MGKLKSAAFELDCVRGGLLQHREAMNDLLEELADLAQEVNGVEKEDAIAEWDRVKRKIRLLHTVAAQMQNEYQEVFAELDETTSTVFDEAVRKPRQIKKA